MIVEPIKACKLSLISLHSAHWSTPFVEAMNERTRLDARSRYPDPANGPPVQFEFVAPIVRFAPASDSMVTPAYYAVKQGGVVHRVRVDLPNCCFPDYRAESWLVPNQSCRGTAVAQHSQSDRGQQRRSKGRLFAMPGYGPPQDLQPRPAWRVAANATMNFQHCLVEFHGV